MQLLQLLQDLKKEVKEGFAGVDKRFDALETSMTVLQTDMKVLQAKQFNSTLSRTDELKIVPKPDGSLPAKEDYPYSFECLLVAGNESLPGSGARNYWNRHKSKKLLRAYDTADSDSGGSGADDEQSGKARHRRILVAKTLGITLSQLNLGNTLL